MILHVTLNQVGKLADLVLWNPALFGSKPEIVVKGGQIAWSQMGKIFCIFKLVKRNKDLKFLRSFLKNLSLKLFV